MSATVAQVAFAVVSLAMGWVAWMVWIGLGPRRKRGLAGLDHTDCANLLRQMVAAYAMDAHVSAEAPIVHNQWTQRLTCPHGIGFWAEPTGEQLAAWVRGAAS